MIKCCTIFLQCWFWQIAALKNMARVARGIIETQPFFTQKENTSTGSPGAQSRPVTIRSLTSRSIQLRLKLTILKEIKGLKKKHVILHVASAEMTGQPAEIFDVFLSLECPSCCLQLHQPLLCMSTSQNAEWSVQAPGHHYTAP